MTPPKKCIATRACLLLVVLGAAAVACAAPPAGTVTALDGRLLAKSTSGTIRVLSLDSPMQAGDLLATKKNTYARVNLSDGGSLTLQPDTFLRVEQYAFEAANPQRNVVLLNLSKGGLRIVSGKIGKQGGSFKLVTPSSTIDVDGATVIVQYVAPMQTGIALRRVPLMLAFNDSVTRSDATAFAVSAEAWQQPLLLAQNTVPNGTNGMNPGLYVQVLDGAIHLTNAGGTQNFTAGQFGYTPTFQQPPVILPSNPGMQFTPPPSFSSTTGSTGGNNASKPGSVDCVVR